MLDDNVIIDAIVATENLLETACRLQVSKDIIALAEEFYVLLPFEQFRRIEVALENRYSGCGSSSRKILIWYECNIFLLSYFFIFFSIPSYLLVESKEGTCIQTNR
jgi:hypothetical protein